MAREKNMKKILYVIVVILLVSDLSQATITQKDIQSSEKNSEWVLMYYLNGDNLLSAVQVQILEELLQKNLLHLMMQIILVLL